MKSTYNEAQKFVEFAMTGLVPIVERAEKAIEKYNESPSIPNGSYMADMKKLVEKAIENIGKLLWSAWKDTFKKEVTEEEYNVLMAKALKKLRPEGEENVWFSRIVPEAGKELK